MATVLLVLHLILAVSLIASVLLQRSEGGALGIGGGGGLMTGRAAASVLTRTSAILGACFFATSISLTLIAQYERSADSILDEYRIPEEVVPSEGAVSAPALEVPLVPDAAPAEPVGPRVPDAD